MSRKFLITIHMYLSAFFAPAVLLVAISGGLYLAGFKGEVDQKQVYQSNAATIDPQSDQLNTAIQQLLAEAGVTQYSFEYVKVKGQTLYTRPTSTDHYIINLTPAGAVVTFAQPNLQARMIELHKGHGPSAFKTFQKVFAVGLVLIILSGVWLGVSASRLRQPTLITVVAGAIVSTLLLL